MSRQVLFSRTIDPPIRSSTVSGAPFKWRREWDYLIRSAHEISSLAAARFESTPFEPCTVNQNTPDPLRRVRGVLMAEGVGFEPTVGCPTLDFESSALNRTQPSLHFTPGDFVLRIDMLRILCGYASLSTTTFAARHAAMLPQ